MSIFQFIMLAKSFVWLCIVATVLYLAHGLYQDFHRKLSKRDFYERTTFEVTFLEGVAVLVIGLAFNLPSIAVTGVVSLQFLLGLYDQVQIGERKPLRWYNWI